MKNVVDNEYSQVENKHQLDLASQNLMQRPSRLAQLKQSASMAALSHGGGAGPDATTAKDTNQNSFSKIGKQQVGSFKLLDSNSSQSKLPVQHQRLPKTLIRNPSLQY